MFFTRVNRAHRYVSAEANILRRVLTPEEHADIRHYEVCWVEAVYGERLTYGMTVKSHVYVVITSRNLHFIDTKGVDPFVRTIPLKEVDTVEAQGPVAPFQSREHNENAARLVITRKVNFAAAMALSEDEGSNGELEQQLRFEESGLRERGEVRRSLRDPNQFAEEMANRRANAEAAVTASKTMMGRMISKMRALSSSSSSSSMFNKRSAAAADVAPPPPTPPPPRRGDSAGLRERFLSSKSMNQRADGWGAAAIGAGVGPGPVTEGWSGAEGIASEPRPGHVTEAVMGAIPLHHGTKGSAVDTATRPGHFEANLIAAMAKRPPPLPLGPVKKATAAAMNPGSAAADLAAAVGGYTHHNNNNNNPMAMRTSGHFDVSAAAENARVSSERSRGGGLMVAAATVVAGNGDGGGVAASTMGSNSSSPRELEDKRYLYEHVSVITYEKGSQVMYQLECAVVRLHSRRAVRAATEAAASNPATPRHSPGQLSSLVNYVPCALLHGASVAAAVSAISPHSSGGVTPNDVTSLSSLAVAAELVENARATSRRRDGKCTFDAALALPPPPPPSSSRLSLNRSVMDQMLDRPDLGQHTRREAERRADEEARLGLILAAPLAPAVTVAVSVLQAVRLHDWADEEAHRRGAVAAVPGAGAGISAGLINTRELFGDLEVAMLAPRNMGEDGRKPLVESVGSFDVRDLCAAAAMAEHFRRVPKMRHLALAPESDLFDVTVQRLTHAARQATHPSPRVTLARRRAKVSAAEARVLDATAARERAGGASSLAAGRPAVTGGAFMSAVSSASAAQLRRGDGVSNWARLVGALRQGAAAHRAVQLFAWVRAALAGSEGAPHERANIVLRRDSMESLVHAAFAFTPLQHAALRSYSGEEEEEEDKDDEDDAANYARYGGNVDLTRLRRPERGVSAGVMDLLVDVLYEMIKLAEHAALLGGDNLASKHLVSHIVKETVPPHVLRPKVAGMFARLVNLSLKRSGPGASGASSITGGDAVRAYRCGFVLRHLIEGIDGGVVVRHIREEYEYEMKFVLSRPGVHDRQLDGDVFFEQHARRHYEFVMAQCLPPVWHGARREQNRAQQAAAAAGRHKIRAAASAMSGMKLASTQATSGAGAGAGAGAGTAAGGEIRGGGGGGGSGAETSALTSLETAPRFAHRVSSGAAVVEPPHDFSALRRASRVVGTVH